MLKKDTKIIGGFYALLGAVMFSTKAVFVKLAYQYEVDAISLLMLRMLFSMPFFLIIGYISIRKNTGSFKRLLSHKSTVFVLGLLGYYIASYLDLVGLQYIDASLERIILFIYPTLVVIFSFIWFKTRISKNQIVAILITYIGIFIAFKGNVETQDLNLVYKGGAFVLLSAISYAVYLVGTGNLSVKLGTRVYNSYAMLTASLAIIIHNYFVHGFNLFSFSSEVYMYAIIISLFATVIPSYLIVEGIRIIGANNSSIIGSIGPVSTIILAIILLGEKIYLTQAIGSLIVIIGVMTILLYKKRT